MVTPHPSPLALPRGRACNLIKQQYCDTGCSASIVQESDGRLLTWNYEDHQSFLIFSLRVTYIALCCCCVCCSCCCFVCYIVFWCCFVYCIVICCFVYYIVFCCFVFVVLLVILYIILYFVVLAVVLSSFRNVSYVLLFCISYCISLLFCLILGMFGCIQMQMGILLQFRVNKVSKIDGYSLHHNCHYHYPRKFNIPLDTIPKTHQKDPTIKDKISCLEGKMFSLYTLPTHYHK